MIRTNFLKEKLDLGQVVIGTWCIIPSAITVEIIAHSGVDFIIIDNEHGSISFETAQQMVIACELNGVSPMYRPSGVNEGEILKGLDIGVHGIQVPNIIKSDQVKEIIQYAKFPPIGNRGFSPFIRAAGYSHNNSSEHYNIANKNTLLAINIEGKESIDNIEDFLAIPEIDIIFIGAFDLSKSMGIPGEVNHPELLQQMEFLTKKIRKAGKHAGTITTTIENISMFMDYGMDYIVHLVDCEILRGAYESVVNKFNFYK